MGKGHRPSRPHGTKAAKSSGKGARTGKDGVRLWGRHAVEAALANPARTIRKLWITHETAGTYEKIPAHIPLTYADNAALGMLVTRDSPHQGIVLDVDPLPDVWLEEVLIAAEERGATGPILVLDQVTDPHNIGAILRSAAAFDAIAIVTQDRHAPPESGVIGRAASGALEIIPWVRVVNLARALEEIGEHGYWRIALTGDAKQTLDACLDRAGKVALVLGAEGAGLRHNSIQHCDDSARLPISSQMESLNVSNAAAIALYAATTARSKA